MDTTQLQRFNAISNITERKEALMNFYYSFGEPVSESPPSNPKKGSKSRKKRTKVTKAQEICKLKAPSNSRKKSWKQTIVQEQHLDDILIANVSEAVKESPDRRVPSVNGDCLKKTSEDGVKEGNDVQSEAMIDSPAEQARSNSCPIGLQWEELIGDNESEYEYEIRTLDICPDTVPPETENELFEYDV